MLSLQAAVEKDIFAGKMSGTLQGDLQVNAKDGVTFGVNCVVVGVGRCKAYSVYLTCWPHIQTQLLILRCLYFRIVHQLICHCSCRENCK